MGIGVLTIRADSSSTMGTGHVMRMIALGQAWQDRGGSVHFIGDVGLLMDRLLHEDFTHTPILFAHPNPEDAQTTLAHIEKGGWLVLDGYHFGTAYQQTMRDNSIRTLVLDDVCDRGQYAADALLNQNSDATAYQYDINDDTQLLLGTRYTLLRREFRSTPAPEKEQPAQANNILITMGGADPDNVTGTIVDALSQLDDTSLHIKIICGAANPHLPKLEAALDQLSCTTELLINVTDMPEVMAWADLAISAAGSTCWELCYFGVPLIAVQIADNQKGICSELERIGAAVCLNSEAPLENISTILTSIREDVEKRTTMAAAGKQCIDGRGALRVTDHLYCSDLKLRPATMDDCSLLLNWRNHPKVREQSFTTAALDSSDHNKWYQTKMADAACHIFIAEDASGKPVGQFRFDIEGNAAYISLSTDPDMTGRGIGTAMTRRACAWLRETHIGIISVALVKMDNPGSAIMFEKAGFTLIETTHDEDNEFHRYEF